MSEYKIHFHHSTAKQGHYYIEFASPYLSSTDQKFFGKNPSIANMPIWKGVILDEKDFHSEMKLAKTLITTTREVNREEFLAGYSFAKNVDGGIYTAWGTTTTEDNCITFGQQVHAASGGQAHFINLFSKEQLASANNVAADHSIRNYYDSGARFVSGESIDHVSSVYGVAKDRVVPRGDGVADPESGIIYHKTFTILPQPQSQGEQQGPPIPPPKTPLPTPPPTAGNSGQKENIFSSYKKPEYLDTPIFQMKNSFSDNKLINEPDWLYRNKKDNGDYVDGYLKRAKATDDLHKSIKSCLGSWSCYDTTSTLIDRAIQGSFGIFDRPSFSFKWGLQREAQNTARDFFNSQSSFSSLSKGFSFGTWSHPLRSELKYAASHVSPLVLDLNGDGIKLSPYTKGVYFDIDNDGFAEKVGWLSPEDGHLAMDVNKNGEIDDITELFGDDMISAYFKLSLLDSNNDKVIDDKDEEFKDLLIWQDRNSNGFSEPDELRTLKQVGISNISLTTKPDDRVIEGNTITSTSVFTYEDGRQGEVADVHYHNDDMDSWYKEKVKHKSASEGFFAEVKSFRKEMLEALSEKIRNPNNIDPSTDWVGEIIKLKTKAHIERYKSQKEEEIKQLNDKKNDLNNHKKAESQKACTEEQARLKKEANEKYASTTKEEEARLLEEINSKLKQEIENINSRYTQEYLKEKEALLNNINDIIARQNQANDGTYQTAQNGGWTQQQYEQAVAANNAQFTVERDSHIAVLSVLKNRYEQLASQEIEKAKEKYQKEYSEDSNKLMEELEALKQKESGKLAETAHKHNQACGAEVQGIKSILTDQLIKYVQAAKELTEEFSDAIKEEANQVYKYFIDKLIKEAMHTETASDSNSAKPSTDSTGYNDLGEASDWLSDEFFSRQQHNNTDNGGIKIDPQTLLLPLMRGYGTVPALHIAMTHSAKLKDLVIDFIGLKPADFYSIQEKVMKVLYEWVGVSEIDENIRATAGGANIEARKVAFVEKITGQEFKQLGAAKFVGQHASTAVQKAWDIALIRATKNLLVQGPLASLFPKAEYSFAADNLRLNSTLSEILSVSKSFAEEHSLGYDFWVQLGYILALSADELNSNIDELRSKLSELAGELVFIDIGTFGLIGDDNDNIIKGTSGSDYIKGLGGNDKLYGKGGSDHIEGDDGHDELYGDAGIDRLHGGAGNDKIYGGQDRDFIYGNEGDDEIYGEEGDDHIEGGEGADKMDGGEGHNTLSYGDSPVGVRINLATNEASGGHAEGDTFRKFQNLGGSEFSDYLNGDIQDNYINGEGGNDEIHGGKGNDDLFGATGEDKLFGEEGDDTLTGFEGIDHMDGGEGTDTVSYHHPYSTHGVNVNLLEGKGVGGYAHGDTYKDIENVHGTKHNDVITGDNNDNILHGHEGDDVIDGQGGDDTIIGGSGNDRLFGGEGDDRIILGMSSDIAVGGNGTDTVSYELSPVGVKLNMVTGKASLAIRHEDTFLEFENAIGTNYDDELIGDNNDNRLFGLDGEDIIKAGGGNDILFGGAGNNKLYGEDGNDWIIGGSGKDEIDGGEGIDTVDYSNESTEGIRVSLERKTNSGGFAKGDKLISIENVVGTKFNDVLIGDEQNNDLFGLKGDDELKGGGGNDRLSGGEGKNFLDGGSEIDSALYNWSVHGVYINLAIGKSSNETIDILINDTELRISKEREQLYAKLETLAQVRIKQGDIHSEVNDWRQKEIAEFEDKSKAKLDNLLDIKLGQALFEDTYIDIEGVEGSSHSDWIIGDDNNNHLFGGDGDDYINGGGWNDKLYGGNGNNILEGGHGDDEFYLDRGTNNVDGGIGRDKVSYIHYNSKEYLAYLELINKETSIRLANIYLPSVTGQNFSEIIFNNQKGVEISLATGKAQKQDGLTDNFINIENIDGSHYDDMIYGDDNNNILDGINGNDEIHGGKGNDTIICGRGKCSLYGDEGDDVFKVKYGAAHIFGGEGENVVDLLGYKESAAKAFLSLNTIFYDDDIQYKLENITHFRGTDYNDIIHDSLASNHIAGGKGDDTIYLTDGDDMVAGDIGNDIIYLSGNGKKNLSGGYGKDTYVIHDTFTSPGELDTIIVDFEIQAPHDVIDLSYSSKIQKLSDMEKSEFTENNLSYTVLKIGNDKYVSLYGISPTQLQSEHFIFFDPNAEL